MSLSKGFNMYGTIFRQKPLLFNGFQEFFFSNTRNYKVAVIGATGGIGSPLSMLLKMNSNITQLALHDDTKHTCGVAVDVSHIEYPAHVTGHVGPEFLKDALKCADVVVIPAGVPRKPNMTRDDLFATNANVVLKVTEAISQYCPKAIVAVITNPINSVIPVACEVMKKAGKLDEKRIFGITTLDNVRAASFIAQKLKISPKDVMVPIIGGHSGDTIVPVFSRAHPKIDMCGDELKKLTHDIQDAGTAVVKAKVGAGSATLSMAYSAARFVNSILCGLKGEPNVVECAYVKTNICECLDYFAAPVVLGKNGAEKVCSIGKLSDYENELLTKAVGILKKNIEKGVDFVKNAKSGSDSCVEKAKEGCPKPEKPKC